MGLVDRRWRVGDVELLVDVVDVGDHVGVADVEPVGSGRYDYKIATL